MLLDAAESQLVLVDYQERLMPAIFEGPAVVANARRPCRDRPHAGSARVGLWFRMQVFCSHSKSFLNLMLFKPKSIEVLAHFATKLSVFCEIYNSLIQDLLLNIKLSFQKLKF